MGKKSLKISKNHHPHHHRQPEIKKPQLSSSIKVLKPKVYITHSSNFKTLVQQLTGNASPVSSPAIPPTPIAHNPRYQEPSLDELCMDNNNSSFHEIPVDIPCMEETFNMVYEFPERNNLEPWDFATDNLCSYDNSVGSCDDDVCGVPFISQQDLGLSVFDYDICCSYDDYPIIQY
nr:dual specificity tyrosine-phosphorylation-regulated kinase 1A-like [Ipomoea batatas]